MTQYPDYELPSDTPDVSAGALRRGARNALWVCTVLGLVPLVVGLTGRPFTVDGTEFAELNAAYSAHGGGAFDGSHSIWFALALAILAIGASVRLMSSQLPDEGELGGLRQDARSRRMLLLGLLPTIVSVAAGAVIAARSFSWAADGTAFRNYTTDAGAPADHTVIGVAVLATVIGVGLLVPLLFYSARNRLRKPRSYSHWENSTTIS